jgi:hypothetical protein
VETQFERQIPVDRAYRSTEVRALGLFGPLTIVGGILWAVVQPWRLTLLHPHHQGLWWLIVEPPLLVTAAGLFFYLAVAKPLIADLEARDDPAR